MNGVADDVEAVKGRVDDDMEEKIAERMEERALVDGGGLQRKYTWNTLKNAKKNQYMQWNGRPYRGCTWR